MAIQRPRRKSRFLKETSERSGFDNFDGLTGVKRWESISDKGVKVAPDEYDMPAPSSISLGGADISGQPRTNDDTTDIPSVSSQVILNVTASGGISINKEPFILITGSAQAVNITANPQISRGRATQIIGIKCVGSDVTLEDGSGLALHAGRTFVMDSGAIINLIYDGTDNLWREISRSHEMKNLGEL